MSGPSKTIEELDALAEQLTRKDQERHIRVNNPHLRRGYGDQSSSLYQLPFWLVGGGLLVAAGAAVGFALLGAVAAGTGALVGAGIAWAVTKGMRHVGAAARSERTSREEHALADLRGRAKLHPMDPRP